MSEPLPGKGLFGWLGRQVGHIKKAIQTDPAGPKVTYRNQKVEEAEHPEQPGVKLRRTTIDEVIVQKQLPTKDEIGKGNGTRET
ncbi:MAG TPA: hypothetical protein VK797_26580 [Tepidisphaeraceae bacterium]|jgi:hypothetical protein|nr:hypothetical protein [Tepidisphaeraceae bacterium]